MKTELLVLPMHTFCSTTVYADVRVEFSAVSQVSSVCRGWLISGLVPAAFKLKKINKMFHIANSCNCFVFTPNPKDLLFCKC